MSAEVEVAREIARQRRRTNDMARASQAARRGVETKYGPQQFFDATGSVVAEQGVQGGVPVTVRNPDTAQEPVIPNAPTMRSIQGGVEIQWDGSFRNGVWSESISRIEIHRMVDAVDIATSDATQIGTFTSKFGGIYTLAALESDGPIYIRLQTVDLAGVESPVSEVSSATADPEVTPAEAQAMADAAEAAATAASQAYAEAQFAEARDRVAQWTVTGKTTIDGGEVETDSIKSAQIAAGAITSIELAAEVLRSGFTITGSLQIGTDGSRWNPTEGLVIPGVASLSPSAASITAALTATSMTVQKDLLIQGATNQIKGTLNVANGITTPTVKPTIASTWGVLGGRDQPFGAISYGLTPHLTDPTLLLAADAFFGGGMSTIVKATGAAAGAAWAGTKAWQADFYPTGMTSFGANYWVLGSDHNRNGNFYVYKLNTTFDKVAEYAVSFYDGDATYKTYWFNKGRPAIGNDGTNVYVVYANGVSAINLNQLVVATGAWGAIISSLPYAGIGYANISAVHLGDLGGTSGVSFVFTIENLGTFHWNSSAVRLTQYDFWKAGSVDVRGLYWDGAKYLSVGIDGYLRYHGTNAITETVTASYSWYDANATNSKHESAVSPASDTFSRAPKTLVQIDTPLAPDSGITDAGQTDKANMVRIYASKNGASRRLQAGTGTDGALGVDGSGVTLRTLVLDTFNTGSVVENASGVASFSSATNSPGVLQSAGASSTLGWQLTGDGTARFSGIMGGTAFTSTLDQMGGGTNQTISGTAVTQVTGMTRTVDCPGPAAVYEVIFMSWMLPANGHTQIQQPAVDGTLQSALPAGVMIGNASGMGTGTYIWRITGMSAGTRTITIKGWMAAAGQTGGYAGGANTGMIIKRIA